MHTVANPAPSGEIAATVHVVSSPMGQEYRSRPATGSQTIAPFHTPTTISFPSGDTAAGVNLLACETSVHVQRCDRVRAEYLDNRAGPEVNPPKTVLVAVSLGEIGVSTVAIQQKRVGEHGVNFERRSSGARCSVPQT